MGVKVNSFLMDTRGVDTIPLKMILYLTVTGIVIFLVASSWNSLAPVYSGAKDSKQINAAALELLSIQNGYARNILEQNSPDGSTCTVELSMQDISYLAFGVDPDPDMNGNLTDNQWVPENNTIICQYVNGVKDRYNIDGNVINFRKGTLDNTGKWILNDELDTNRNIGILIKGPVEGKFNFELVLADEKYTISHF
ncbi:hypothetical protein RE476_06605 [Methanolobus mangrovi]|uniref:Uncharacterized protein n=1 Tax=Methanolobus mangrovi TaxID=3072977 RepID=A0AA51UDL7_9EURY|nr:hypothetical protein [Methanolobus mangrovi]WMW21088.1 hypothetical protein RE476_06605 [Methanolobus mangrovi]